MTASGSRPLKVGLLLPDTENQMEGETPRWSDIAAFARLAEDVGFDSVWITDHLIHRSDPTESSLETGGDRRELEGPWEGWSLLAAIAAITERVEIGPLVLCNSFRNPALLAKMADTVEEISGGRLILGLGAGWNESEFDAFGYPFDHRVDRFEESIQIITSLLRTGKVDFEGTYYWAKDCELRPRGPRPEGPPILIGTAGERMLGLTATYADHWNTWFSQTENELDKLVALMQRVDAACEAEGRDPATLARSSAVKIEVAPAAESVMGAPPIKGSPEEIATELRAYADAGVDEIQAWIEPVTLAGVEMFGEVLRHLDAS